MGAVNVPGQVIAVDLVVDELALVLPPLCTLNSYAQWFMGPPSHSFEISQHFPDEQPKSISLGS